MKRDNNAQLQHLVYRIYKNYYTDKTNLHGYKFYYEILKVAITIIKKSKESGTVEKVVSYLQKTSFFYSSKCFLIVGGPVTKFVINWFLMKRKTCITNCLQ